LDGAAKGNLGKGGYGVVWERKEGKTYRERVF
jgi:ribonuclease HI